MLSSKNGAEIKHWRKLSIPQLETAILEIRGEAARRHLNAAEWAAVDRMRRRATKLTREERQS
jgi:hypothetical protein